MKYTLITAFAISIATTGFFIKKNNDAVHAINSRLDSILNTKNHVAPTRKNRIIKPKTLAVRIDGAWYRVDSIYAPFFKYRANGKLYDQLHGYAIDPNDSGRVLIQSPNLELVYPSDPRYYKGHEDGTY